MREIKFRVWDKDYKEYIPNDGNPNVFPFNGKIGLTFNESGNGYINTADWIQDKYIIEQYTGLKSADGKEIYEGDLLSNNFETSKEVIRQVVFENGCYFLHRVKGTSRLPKDILLYDYIKFNYMIIGNIYMNGIPDSTITIDLQESEKRTLITILNKLNNKKDTPSDLLQS